MKTTKMIAKIAGAVLAGMMALSFASCNEKDSGAAGANGLTKEQAKLLKGKPAAEADFEISLTKDNSGVVIEKYKGQAKHLVIPATIQGLPVVEVGSDAFGERANVKSVVIPEGVRSIGSQAFNLNKNIETVVFPSSLRVIESSAFYSCSNLKTVNLNEGLVAIAGSAFDSTNLSSVTLPKSLRFLGYLAFKDCNNLSEIIIPENHSIIYTSFVNDYHGGNVRAFYDSLEFTSFFDGTKIKESVALQKLLKDTKTIEVPAELKTIERNTKKDGSGVRHIPYEALNIF